MAKPGSLRIGLVYDAVYPWMKGGGEKALWDIACELRELGHEVHYFGTKFWDGPDQVLRDGITLHGVGRPLDFYNKQGGRTFRQPILFGAALFEYLLRIKMEPLDVINCLVFPYFSVLAIWAALRLRRWKSPLVLNWLEIWGGDYWKNYLPNRLTSWLGAKVELACSHCSRHHMVISPLQKKRLQDLLKVSGEKISMIPRGLHVRNLPRHLKKIPGRVVYSGRLIAYKNLETIIRGWARVLEAAPHATLKIIGSGPSQPHLQELVTKLQLGAKVEILPPRHDWEEAMAEIAQAEVFVQPSLREGQSVVSLEAMACGTIVAAALHPESAVSDFIQHDQNGLLIAGHSEPEAWAEAISSLLNNKKQLVALAAAAKTTADRFDWKTSLAPTLAEYFTETVRSSKKQTVTGTFGTQPA